jgi:hypothetical protein
MIRKMLPALMVFSLFVAALPAMDEATVTQFPGTEITAMSEDAITIGFSLEKLNTSNLNVNGETRSQITIDGEGITWEYGKPVLPAVGRFVVVPPEAGIELIVNTGEARTEKAEYSPTICDDETVDKASVHFYFNQVSELYPPVVAEVSEPMVIRGVRIVKVTTYPVQYNETTGEYIHHDQIETELRFTDDEPVNPAYFPERSNRSPELKKLLRGLAINGDQIGRDDPDRDIEPEYVGHYLIVTNENCLEYIADFIEWRRKSGWKVDILSVPSNQSTNTNWIKGQIQDRYDAYLDDGLDPFDQLLLVGDRDSYYTGCNDMGSHWTLAAETGTSRWGSPPHADYRYALLEGNDQLADLGFSRWCAGSERTLGLFQGRTLAYEAEPSMEDTSWFKRGGAWSQHWGNSAESAWHISIHTNARWAEELLQHLGFEDVRFHERYEWDQMGAYSGPFERDLFNDGSNLHLGRSENYYFRDGLQGVEDNVVFPIRIVASGHGEWTAWNMMRNDQAGPNHLRGPVATTCGWGGPATMDMTVAWLETVNGLLLNDLSFGWAHLQGLMGPRLYVGSISTYNDTDFDAYGDPGIQPWIGVPRVVETDVTQTVTVQTRMVEVFVHTPQSHQAVPGARVTLYAPGDMPAFDENGYAGYDDMLMITTTSGVDGMARFVLDDNVELVEDTPLYITANGRDIRPFFTEVEIGESEFVIEIAEFGLLQAEGNDDEDVNPGEVFELELSATNIGTEDIDDVVYARVISLSPWVEIEGDTLEFEGIEANQTVDFQGEVFVNISPFCPDGESRPVTRPVIAVEFTYGDHITRSGVTLNPVAPNLELDSVVGDGIIGTREESLDVELENVGGMDIGAFTATLLTVDSAIEVVSAEAQYPAISSGHSARIPGDDFRVIGDEQSIPGQKNEMIIILETEDGFIDTVYFEVQVRETGNGVPTGPDEYGYKCFDDTDSNWDLAPRYEWFEISAEENDRDADGELIDFEGDSDFDVGEAWVLDLGFPTQFYGYIYDQITVSTNGFISMGEQPRITNYQNWPMDRAIGGGVGMIAPLWDDLRLVNGSGIYWHHDVPGHRFVVEWYKLRHAQGGNTDLTFQVILYDKRYWVTPTRDPGIIIQYKTIADIQNIRGGDAAWVTGTPYASVGISSPDGGGINYSYNNRKPVSAAGLANRRALFFGIASQGFRAGFLSGHVTDFATGEPIEGAHVYTDYKFETYTDSAGYWEFYEALAEQSFTITASFPEYNDSTHTNLQINDRDTTEINFALLHPEFEPSVWEINSLLDPDWRTEIPFSIQNTGNGPLDWSLDRTLPENADFDPWEQRLSHPASEITGDARLEGVVYVDGTFYVCGSNIRSGVDTTNMIYAISTEGELERSFPQLGDSRYGMKDLAWDGELIWGTDDGIIIGFTTDGDSVTSFDGPDGALNAITWDPDREVIWVARKTGRSIYALNRDGVEIDSLELPRFGLRLYAFAYWTDDPDGYTLYIFSSPDNSTQVVHKINPDTRDTMYVATLDPELGGQPGGAFITNKYDVYSWVFISIANENGEDRIDLWQLQAKRDWFRVYTGFGQEREEPYSGRIDAQETQDFILGFNSRELDMVPFRGFLEFSHNAEDFLDIININLDIIGPRPQSPFALLSPGDGDTLDANIDTTNVHFSWQQSIDPNHLDTLRYHLWLEVDTCVREIITEDNFFDIDILTLADSLGLSVEAAFPLEWWVQSISGEDIVDCDTSFHFQFLPNGLLSDDTGIPVEFGLQTIYPSPFNSTTTVRFGIDKNDRARLHVYDLTGRLVTTLFDRSQAIGNHRVVWDASRVPSGLYIIRLESAGRQEVRKVALIR